AGLVGLLPIDHDLARKNQRLRLLTRISQAALDQQLINTEFCRHNHAVLCTIKSASCFSQSACAPNAASALWAAMRSCPAIARDRSSPYTDGNVIFFCAASLPAVFPSASDDCSTSRISSTIWNASPMCSPKQVSASSWSPVAPA